MYSTPYFPQIEARTAGTFSSRFFFQTMRVFTQYSLYFLKVQDFDQATIRGDMVIRFSTCVI